MVEKIGLKKLIVIAIIVIIAIIAIVLIARGIDRKRSEIPDNKVVDGILPDRAEYESEWSGKVNDINKLGDYYNIKNILIKFYLNYYTMYTSDNENNSFSKATYEMLAKDYCEEHDITVDNIKDKFSEITESQVFIKDGYTVTDYDNNKIFYYVEYYVKPISEQIFNKQKAFIICDADNYSFELFLNDYVEENNLSNYKVGDDFTIKTDKEIEINSSNIYGSGSKSYADYAEEKTDEFRKMLLNSPETAYEMLDDNFKSSTYPTFESFQNFIKANSMNLFLMGYGDYESKASDGETYFEVYDIKSIFYLRLHVKSLAGVKYEIGLL